MKKIVAVAGILLLLQIAGFLVNQPVFPTPIAVFSELTHSGGSLLLHAGFSAGRIFAGVAVSLAVGVPAGIALGYFKRADKAFSPILYLAGPVPKIALLPLIMMVFGIGEMSKVFIIFCILVFQIIVTIRDGVKNIPAEYFLPYDTIHAGIRHIVTDIVLPASLADIFSALRVGLATAISVLFFTETFGTRYGIGFFIMDMWMRLNYRAMYLGIIVLGLLGLLFTIFLDKLEKRLCPWKDKKEKEVGENSYA